MAIVTQVSDVATGLLNCDHHVAKYITIFNVEALSLLFFTKHFNYVDL